MLLLEDKLLRRLPSYTDLTSFHVVDIGCPGITGREVIIVKVAHLQL